MYSFGVMLVILLSYSLPLSLIALSLRGLTEWRMKAFVLNKALKVEMA